MESSLRLHGERLKSGEYNMYIEYGFYAVAVILVLVAAYLVYQNNYKSAFWTAAVGVVLGAGAFAVFRKCGLRWE